MEAKKRFLHIANEVQTTIHDCRIIDLRKECV